MKRALISTLYNEADNVSRWWESIVRQTVPPDEIVIVDGGSKDGTWEKLQELARQSPVPVKLKQQRCNIARGRNLAVQNATADIIAATDAGSFPEQNWFAEITRPLVENHGLDVVGGHSKNLFENEFQKFLEQFEIPPAMPASPAEIYPSSRNVAFRRKAWADVGGYPEWLTLTAEDALFNFELHKIGRQFFYNPAAIVHWPVRDTAKACFKMYYSYGYGAAEARLYTQNYLRHWFITIFPPLLLLSRHRFRHLKFRYQKNAASAFGWLAGRIKGHPVPDNWHEVDGIILSPEALAHLPHNDANVGGNPVR
jgi:glycosyltransferase involved in cell wall biosynthesis